MAGIYIHIPFCRKACSYCDFHFSTSFRLVSQMFEALQKEIQLQKDFFAPDTKLTTLYFGGGTPSVFSPKQIQTLIETVYEVFPNSQETLQEISLEANPEDLVFPSAWASEKTDINRLSIGIQSFGEKDLTLMNRGHAHIDIGEMLALYQNKGYDNISLDLIFGIPDLSETQWQQHLEKVLSYNVQHLSLYALTLEPKTALSHQVKKGQILMPDDSAYSQQFLLADKILTDAGWSHYELSNYAKVGFRSQHNSAYWKGEPYLGIGPSAHSYNGTQRIANVASNPKYIAALKENTLAIVETESLSTSQQYNEYILTQLRKVEGIDCAFIWEKWQINMLRKYQDLISSFVENGDMLEENGHIRLTPSGWLISDYIIRAFFV